MNSIVSANQGFISEEKRGWVVTFAGTGVNLALGILYSWSVIAGHLRDAQGWSAVEAQIPYMIACGVFALVMVPGGRIQDKIGPRTVIIIAGLLAGIGLVVSSFVISVIGLSIFFGVFFGASMGLGYSSTTPPAVKWFGPKKRGTVTGLVVSGFGLSSVYAAPLMDYLIKTYDLVNAFLFIGISFFIIIMFLSQLISNPPEGYIPSEIAEANSSKEDEADGKEQVIKENHKVKKIDYEWHEMLKTRNFYILWLMFCFGSLAGLMVIGQLSSIAFEQANLALGFILVALLAVFNAGGRIVAGVFSDKIGRINVMRIIFALQGINFLLFNFYSNMLLLVIGTALAGLCYGACLSVFPATTADMFGMKNLGVNYGLVFTSWGAGGVFGGLIGGIVRDVTGTYLIAFLIAAALCFIGVGLTYVMREQNQPII